MRFWYIPTYMLEDIGTVLRSKDGVAVINKNGHTHEDVESEVFVEREGAQPI